MPRFALRKTLLLSDVPVPSDSRKASSRGGSHLPVERAVSAGGIVYRRGEAGLEIVICGRDADRVWGLPKGTPEEGEALEETAIREVTEEKLKFARQIGVTGIIVNSPELFGDGFWEFNALLHLRTRVEAAGLKLEAIENLPWNFYYKAMLGLPGRDEQIENWCKTLRNMGAAGIPILGYYFMPLSVWRTSFSTPGRGGAQATSFDIELVKNAPLMTNPSFQQIPAAIRKSFIDTSLLSASAYHPISDEEMWQNFTYFIKAVIPVAEEAGVKMGLHPDDPPVPSLGGVARIMRSVDAFKRVIEIVPSDYNGLELCQGCFSEMGANVVEAIRYFGSRKKIFYVHFRDVRGTADNFAETFIDEGQTDMFQAMKAYKEVGFDGPMIVDHTLRIVDDSDWGHRGRAYAMGYIKALIDTVNAVSGSSEDN